MVGCLLLQCPVVNLAFGAKIVPTDVTPPVSGQNVVRAMEYAISAIICIGVIIVTRNYELPF